MMSPGYFSRSALKEYASPFNCFRINEGQSTDPHKLVEEWTIINIIKLIRDNPDWKNEYKNSTVTAKWKLEYKPYFRSFCYEEVWDYVLKELAWNEYVEHNFPNVKSSGFHLGCDEKIVYSDIAVKEETRKRLQKSVENFVAKEFANGPDYHSDSDKQEIDIVDPSLYPVQYRKTPVYIDNNLQWAKELLYDDLDKPSNWGLSKNYQWLPALVSWPSEGKKKLGFRSYINNIHPDYDELYGAIEDILNAAVPGINLSLAMLKLRNRVRVKILYPLYDDEWFRMVDDHKKAEKEFLEEHGELVDLEDEFGNYVLQHPELDDSERYNHVKAFKPIYKADPPLDFGFSIESFPHLKIIVKLSNIALTPEKPNFAGKSWNYKGMANEDIVATVMYYYDSENITDPKLSFKASFEESELPKMDSHPFFSIDLDLAQILYGPKLQLLEKKIGTIVCHKNRVVVIPNWYQCRAESFELIDSTKSGSLKMLCIHVVDPHNTKTITSAAVPPQQPKWVEKQAHLNKLYKQGGNDVCEKWKESKFNLLPHNWPSDVQKFDTITFDFEGAQVVKKKLIEERKALVKENPYLIDGREMLNFY